MMERCSSTMYEAPVQEVGGGSATRQGKLASPGGSANFEINPMDHSRATRLQNLRRAARCGAVACTVA
jgi:hypothetical protein